MSLQEDLHLVDEWHPKDKVLLAAAKKTRLDGRKHDEGRAIDIQTAIFKQVYGSASIRRGKSYYFSCATASIGLEESVSGPPIQIRLQLPHILGCEFGLNRQSDAHMQGENIEMTLNTWTECVCAQVSRILSNSIDKSLLSIFPLAEQSMAKTDDNNDSDASALKYVWRVQIDVTCLDYEGNLFDQVLLCALGALIDLKLPALKWDEERRWWKTIENTVGVSDLMLYIPIPVTSYQIEPQTFLIDPDRNESSIGVPFTVIYLVPKILDGLDLKDDYESILFNFISIPQASANQFDTSRKMLLYCEKSANVIFNIVKPLTKLVK
eukprot:Gregarina_sp_Poly_1__1998@NODE_1524_length_3932_cov_80_621734_g1008_i0_p1_GENE_NODE_1524_length_3932_cov_80_621734_g1008_i0NODE_1524_length_3932_cov_80_621734_g1008_i0_p1_ORF_typecomplete_len323_score24_37RNase_PH/PF01138_21/1_5e13_NODE_1524_length_3932_cov_80_621734_g1008_i018672835